ncbi:MAG TPA: hypothetical protein VFN23_05525 [Ktedonobacteraceae bacterium]|nr:hypothetical protein [Ktedonobacteraceae bacterium]
MNKPKAGSSQRSLLGWWYRFSAPEEALWSYGTAMIPRGKLASILLLIMLVSVGAFIPAAITSDSLHIVPPLIGMFLATCLAIVLNKLGHVTWAGIVLVAAFDCAMAEALLSYPNFVLPQNAVPIYDMFVLSDIIAISLLPIKSIFFISSFHSIFMMADIILQPHTPDLQALVDSTTYSFMVRPLCIQIIVALIMYLWVRNTMKELERANKAEVIAHLEHTIALERNDLQEGIQQLLYTLVETANGNLNIQAPLAQQHALWKVGVGLNTLIARLKRAEESKQELYILKREIYRLLASMQESKDEGRPLWLPPGGTDLDLIISELLFSIVSSSPQTPAHGSGIHPVQGSGQHKKVALTPYVDQPTHPVQQHEGNNHQHFYS